MDLEKEYSTHIQFYQLEHLKFHHLLNLCSCCFVITEFQVNSFRLISHYAWIIKLMWRTLFANLVTNKYSLINEIMY